MNERNYHTLVFTPEQIADMEREEARLTEVMNDTRHKLDSVRMILRGAKAFQKVEDKPIEPPKSEEEVDETPSSAVVPSNMMGTLAKIVNEHDDRMSKKELKRALIAAGVDEKRVKGPYFYVALNRLYDRDRITLYQDGTIGKAEPPE